MARLHPYEPFPHWDDFSGQLEQGLSQVFSAPSGKVLLGIHPHEGLGQIIQMGKHPLPATRGRINLSSEHIVREGQPWTLLNVANLAPAELEETYSFLTLIGKAIEDGVNIGNATADALQVMGHILARERRMSTEEEIGLIAELIFLESAIHQLGLDVAVTGWTGPEGGNHDFEFPQVSFEVKATRSPERRHRISSEHQLESIPTSELRLASFQFAASAEHGGIHLPSLIECLFESSEHMREVLVGKLRKTGWSTPREGVTYGHWKQASEPLEFEVNDEFPRLTRPSLETGISSMDRIDDVTYTIHLEGLPASEPVILKSTTAVESQ